MSTSAGISDFRGKNGVWTKLKNEKVSNESINKKIKLEDIKPEDDQNKPIKPFDEAKPTFAHMALKRLCELGFIKHIVSQNVDGLFLKSDLKRNFISELHGNFFLDECTVCKSRYIRSNASKTMRLQKSQIRCSRLTTNKTCKGYLRDTILDWESPIPHNELRVATRESKNCDLHICIGTSIQLRPSRDLVCKPNLTKGSRKKLVIINLQPTKFDQHANLIINHYIDDVMIELTKVMNIEVNPYDPSQDPTQIKAGTMWLKKEPKS